MDILVKCKIPPAKLIVFPPIFPKMVHWQALAELSSQRNDFTPLRRLRGSELNHLPFYPTKVIYVADSLRLDLLRLGQSGNPLVSVIGDLDWICSDIGVASPLPFTADLVRMQRVMHTHSFYLTVA